MEALKDLFVGLNLIGMGAGVLIFGAAVCYVIGGLLALTGIYMYGPYDQMAHGGLVVFVLAAAWLVGHVWRRRDD